MENSFSENLYIIGNGFDRHHNVKCEYSNFRDWLAINYPMLSNRLFQTYDLYDIDLWSSLEKNLGEISPQAILGNAYFAPFILQNVITNEFQEINMDDEPDIISEIGYTLEEMCIDLQESFSEWILQLNAPNISNNIYIEKNNSLFINFNYTSTLENAYGIDSSKILYIHGCAAKNDYLIFGHNRTYDDLLQEWGNDYSDEDFFSLQESANELGMLYKDVDGIIKNHVEFFEQIRFVKSIYVLGLSISDVDFPYIRYINSIINSNKVHWEFSWFSESDKNRIYDVTKELDIRNFTLIRLDDLKR